MSQTSSTTYNPFPGGITLDNLDEVLAFHAATFKGWRMEDEGGESSTDESSEESGEESNTEGDAPEGDGAGEENGDSNEGEGESQEDELPEWARKQLSKARGEAATYRTRLREIEQKFENAKTAEEYDVALHDLREENEKQARALLVENVALKYELPEELAARLQGATREELEADAKALAKFASPGEEDPELLGGLDPHNRDTTPDDPAALARRVNRGRRKRR